MSILCNTALSIVPEMLAKKHRMLHQFALFTVESKASKTVYLNVNMLTCLCPLPSIAKNFRQNCANKSPSYF